MDLHVISLPELTHLFIEFYITRLQSGGIAWYVDTLN